MTIAQDKIDAKAVIERETDKMRQKHISWGIFTTDGYRFKYDIAVAWDDVEPAPQAIQDLADYRDETNALAKAYILDTMAAMQELFRVSDKLKYNAKKEIDSCSTTAEVRKARDKHVAIFEAAMAP